MPLSAALSAPANEDERKHVGELLETVEVKTGKAGRPRKKVSRLAADKGYDSDSLRNYLKEEGIQPGQTHDFQNEFIRLSEKS